MIVSILLGGVWQGAFIFGAAYVLSCTIPRRDAATRSALWFTTLVALAAVPVLATLFHTGTSLVDTLRIAAPHSAAYRISLIPADRAVGEAGLWLAPAIPWILGLWLAGVAIALSRLAVSFAGIARIRRNARPLFDAAAGIFASNEIAVPMVAGIVTPVIVIPDALASALAPADLARVVEHERAHIRRKDPVSNLIARVIEAALFFNPWVHLAVRALCAEREAACDDRAIEATGNADDYAVCLAALAQSARLKPAPLLSPTAFRSRRALISRIERLGSNAPRRLTINPYALGGTVMLFVITTLALQAFAPAFTLPNGDADPVGASARPAVIAAACAHPNVDASVKNAVAPELPNDPKLQAVVDVAVTIGSTGKVLGTKVVHSSGNPKIDNAVVRAARESTYSPKVVNCVPVQGGYVFHAEMTPD